MALFGNDKLTKEILDGLRKPEWTCSDPECHTDFAAVFKEMCVRGERIEELEKTVAELTKKFETQRSARRKYKKQLNRLSGNVVKKARGGA